MNHVKLLIGATFPQNSSKAPQGQQPFLYISRHIKQKRQLQNKHLLCLDLVLFYITQLHLGHSLYDGTITDIFLSDILSFTINLI